MAGGESSSGQNAEYANIMALVTDEAEYLRAFDENGGDLESINFEDSDLQYRLDQQLSVVVQNEEGGHDDNDAWRIHASLLGIDLTVRDALVIGLNNLWGIRGIGSKRLGRVRAELRRYIPEFPPMDDYAPPIVANKFYSDPNDVPIAAPVNGQRVTVGLYLQDPSRFDFYSSRAHAVIQAYGTRDESSSQAAGSVSDPTLSAIAAVAMTFNDSGDTK